MCGGLPFEAIDTEDLSFDLEAYAGALKVVNEECICFLNTNSEINAPPGLPSCFAIWTHQASVWSAPPAPSRACATSTGFSRNTRTRICGRTPSRSGASTRELLGSYAIETKLDAFFAESGPDGLTRKILSLGLTCLVVGGDGRGYAPHLWPNSETARQGTQSNVLVHDNYTRGFDTMDARECEKVVFASWGRALPARVVEM